MGGELRASPNRSEYSHPHPCAKRTAQVGLEGLSEEERGAYVADPSGFIQSVKFPSFKLYAERFILPAYAQRARQEQQQGQTATASRYVHKCACMVWLFRDMCTRQTDLPTDSARPTIRPTSQRQGSGLGRNDGAQQCQVSGLTHPVG